VAPEELAEAWSDGVDDDEDALRLQVEVEEDALHQTVE
jgi:hypothetical protein